MYSVLSVSTGQEIHNVTFLRVPLLSHTIIPYGSYFISWMDKSFWATVCFIEHPAIFMAFPQLYVINDDSVLPTVIHIIILCF